FRASGVGAAGAAAQARPPAADAGQVGLDADRGEGVARGQRLADPERLVLGVERLDVRHRHLEHAGAEPPGQRDQRVRVIVSRAVADVLHHAHVPVACANGEALAVPEPVVAILGHVPPSRPVGCAPNRTPMPAFAYSSTVTRRRPMWRMPRMIRGRARIVAVRSPPPSCMITIEPGSTRESTARTMPLAVRPGAQSRGSTDHRTTRQSRLDAIATTRSDQPPPGGRNRVGCTPSEISVCRALSICVRTTPGRCSPNGGVSGWLHEWSSTITPRWRS